MREKESMKRLALALCFAALAVSACVRPVLQVSPVDSQWTLVEARDWRTRAPGLIGKHVELHGNLSTQFLVDPGSEFSNTGAMRDTNYKDVLATVLFDQISGEQIAWMAKNNCHVTGVSVPADLEGHPLRACEGVYVRGVVEVVGAGPVLDMIDISCKSRAGGVAVRRNCDDWNDQGATRILRDWSRSTQVHHASAVALAAAQHDSAGALAVATLNAQEALGARTGTSAAADTGWMLVAASDWRTRAPGLIGKRVELSGDLSTQPLLDPRSSLSNRGAMRGQIRRQILAIVLFDQISNEQVTWMARNACLITCKGVFVRGLVVIVGAGPVLQMIDVSSESRAGGGAATPVLAAPAPKVQEVPASETDVPAAGDSGWTLVQSGDWQTRAPRLIGRRVELSGNLRTQLYVDPNDSFSNTGTMIGPGFRQIFATVLFNQISTEQASWFRTNNCLQTCEAVFVRGVVVSGQRGPVWREPACRSPQPPPRCAAQSETPPVLQMSDISFESRAGGVAVSMVRLDTTHGLTPAVQKQLLPPGGVPERHRDLNMQRGMIHGPARQADFETSYRSIRDTRLLNVFANYPWNNGGNEWPRVALVVEEQPAGGTGEFEHARGGQKITDRCWRLRARLWTGPASSQDIAPFNWCLSEMRSDVAYNDVALWGRSPHGAPTSRTLGPIPPFTPVPTLQYGDGLRGDTIMLGNILLDMSFGLGMPDGRVWIVQ